MYVDDAIVSIAARKAWASSADMSRVVLFTQQTVGLGARKTGMVFWAETLASLGWDTSVVTVQLSWLSRLARVPRLVDLSPEVINHWYQVDPNLRSMVWVPPIHPARFGPLDQLLGGLSAAVYPMQLPRSILQKVECADLVVIESCCAVALFDRLRRTARKAQFVYCASDRLDAVGMQPALSRILEASAFRYDLVRVPARSMLTDFPAGTLALYIPHGVDKTELDGPLDNPFQAGGVNAVVAGDMRFDARVIGCILNAFPHLTVHAFGRMDLTSVGKSPNLIEHGEVPFERLAPYLKHADVGLAPYVNDPRLEYLSDSSLKLLQYTHCRLPIVAPTFIVGDQGHIFGYDDLSKSLVSAVDRALAYDRSLIDRSGVLSWGEVIEQLLTALAVPENVASSETSLG